MESLYICAAIAIALFLVLPLVSAQQDFNDEHH